MYEYEVILRSTGQRTFCWGYNLADAAARRGWVLSDIDVLSREYID